MAREEVVHKGLNREYEIFCGVEAGLKDIILEAVDIDYALEIKDEILGFLCEMPKQIIAHLCKRGGQLDFANMKKLITERDSEWDGSEVPQVYFNRVKKSNATTPKSWNCIRLKREKGHDFVLPQSNRRIQPSSSRVGKQSNS